MQLQKLKLTNYKNLQAKEFSFTHTINCLVGRNGVGKTNVLDAIYHLSYGKSYFNPIASQNITHGCDFFRVEGHYTVQNKSENIVILLKKGASKKIERNGKVYKKISDHIGLLPLVIISPTDRDLILEGSDTRRKFLDAVIAQNNIQYLQDLINYQKVLAQRNALLKYFAANHTFNPDTLDVYNSQLHDLGTTIFEARKQFISTFKEALKQRYQELIVANSTHTHENVDLLYKSDLHTQTMQEALQTSLEKDRYSQYTQHGIHKDDLIFTLNQHPIKKFGSQGQQKTYLIALKLAQFDCYKTNKNVAPILLLDDIFDKLDNQRVTQLIKCVEAQQFGQLFISDTDPERTEQIVKQVNQEYQLINLDL